MLQSNVPAYILKDLLPHLSLQDICRCRVVSKSWNQQFKSFTQQITSPQKPVNLFVQVPLASTNNPQNYLLKVVTPCPPGLLSEGECEEFYLDLKAQIVKNSENELSTSDHQIDIQTLSFRHFIHLINNSKKVNLSWTHQINIEDYNLNRENQDQQSIISAQVLNFVISELTQKNNPNIKNQIQISISLTLPYACQPFTTNIAQISNIKKQKTNYNNINSILNQDNSIQQQQQFNSGRSLVSESMTIDLFHGLIQNLDRDVLNLVSEVKWDGMPIGWWGDTLNSVFPSLRSVCVENATGSAVASILGSVENLEKLQLFGGHRLGQVLRDVACSQGSKALQELRIRFCNGDQAITALMRSAVVEHLNFDRLQRLELIVERGLWYEDVMCLNSTLPPLQEFTLGTIGIDHSSQIRGVLDTISNTHSNNLKNLELKFQLKILRSQQDSEADFLLSLKQCVNLEKLVLNVVCENFIQIDLWPLQIFGNQLLNLQIIGENLVVLNSQYLYLFQLPVEQFILPTKSVWEFVPYNNNNNNILSNNINNQFLLNPQNSINLKVLSMKSFSPVSSALSLGNFQDSKLKSWHIIIKLVFEMYMLIKRPDILGFNLQGEVLILWRVSFQQMYASIKQNSITSGTSLLEQFKNMIFDEQNIPKLYISRQLVLDLKQFLMKNTNFILEK